MKMTSSTSIFVLLLMSLLCGSCTGEDETTCPEGHIHCSKGDSIDCIRSSQICDGKLDCNKHADEDRQFCAYYLNEEYSWMSDDCPEGEFRCYKFGVLHCFTPTEYCQQDVPCGGNDLDWRVCKVLNSGRLSSLESYSSRRGSRPKPTSVDYSEHLGEQLLATNPVTLSHEDCPLLYTKVGNDCLSFLHPVNVTWGEARGLCQTIGGDLVSFRDLDHYTGVRNHLKYSMQTRDFWIGGRFLSRGKPKASWTWLTGELMPLGFPMWAVRYEPECQVREVTSLLTNITTNVENGTCYHYNEAPRSVSDDDTKELCVAINYQHLYSYSDEDCQLRKSPLCVANQSN